MAAKQIILILQKPDGVAEIVKESSLDLITLPHPKGIPVVYISLSGHILELQSIQLKKHASWFVNQKVSSSGIFYMASKLDPRFLCLPFFEKAGTRFCPLDQIITPTEGCSKFFLTGSGGWSLDEISDVKDLGDDLIVYRFSESKTMEWLNRKVKRTATHFKAVRCSKKAAENVTFVGSFESSAQSSKSSKSAPSSSVVSSEPDTVDILMALQVVADYLTDTLAEKLVKHFGYSLSDLADTKSQSTKRKADWETELEVQSIAYFIRLFHKVEYSKVLRSK